MFFPRTDDSYCYRIHSSLTAVHYFDDGCVEKQPVALKEYCAVNLLPDVPTLGSSNSTVNKYMTSKIWTNGDTII